MALVLLHQLSINPKLPHGVLGFWGQAESNANAELLLEIKQLREKVRFHLHRYHVLDDPEIPDIEFDVLFDRLVELVNRCNRYDTLFRRLSRGAGCHRATVSG